jgi:hypothetical protein
MKSRYFLIVCLLVCVASPVWATTYYVSTSGNNANSCATATSATATLAKLTMSGGISCLHVGDTLLVHGGTYNDIIFDSMFINGTGTAWTTGNFYTIDYVNDGQVILKPTGTQGNIVRFAASMGIQYVQIKNITLDGSAGPLNITEGIVQSEADNLKFDTVEVRHSTQTGINAYGNHSFYINMHVHGSGTTPNPNSAAEGVYGAGSYNTFIGGEYDNNECNAIRVFSSDRTHKAHDNLVAGITVHDNGFNHAQLLFKGLSQCRTGGGGITIGDYNNTMINNIIYNAYWGYDDTFAQDDFETGGNIIANNTFYNQDYCCLLNDNNTRWQNNICFRVNLLPSCSISSNEGAGHGVNNTVDHNLLNTDPSFVDVTAHNFRLQFGSLAKDTGTTISSVVNDFLGARRPYGPAYDIGAFEFGATASGGPRAPQDPIIH